MGGSPSRNCLCDVLSLHISALHLRLVSAFRLSEPLAFAAQAGGMITVCSMEDTPTFLRFFPFIITNAARPTELTVRSQQTNPRAVSLQVK